MLRRLLIALLPLLALAACDTTSQTPVNTPEPSGTAPQAGVVPPPSSPAAGAATATPSVPTLTVQSADIHDGATIGAAHIYNAFGCTGPNLSPQISWSGAPAATKGFALTVYDTDAPTGSGFWHWVVYDLPASTTSLPRGAGAAGSTTLPAGARQGRNDFGIQAYGGPCPPQGDPPHHYIFTVTAVDVAPLPVPDNPTPAIVGFTIHGHTLATGKLTALYGR